MAIQKYLIGILAFSIILTGSALTQAQNYDPSSVILLKKRDEGKLKTPEQVLEEQKKSQEKPKTLPSNNNITAVPNSGSLVVNPGLGQGNQTDQKTQQMNAAYASHLYTGICSQEYRNRAAPKTEKNLNTQKMWSDIQASCKCLSTEILAQVPPDSLLDYVMFNYGYQDDKKPNPQMAQFNQTPQSSTIGTLTANQALRTKCGFLN